MTIFAVYSDGIEDGRQIRHVHATFPTFEEASTFAKDNDDIGFRLSVRRFEDESEIDGFNIDPHSEFDEWDSREKAWANADFERDQGYLPYGR